MPQRNVRSLKVPPNMHNVSTKKGAKKKREAVTIFEKIMAENNLNFAEKYLSTYPRSSINLK